MNRFFIRFVCLCCVVVAFLWCDNIQSQPLTFRRIGTEQGLSQCTVVAMLQDRYGFMWFCTQDGLNRFDGYTFNIYKHNPADSTSLSSSMILSIYEDHEGILWVGTYNGLNRFDRASGTFTRYYPDSVRTPQKCGIWNMSELLDGRFVVTTSSGLFQFNARNRQLVTFATSDESNNVFRGKFCQRVPNHHGRFLVRVERQLFEYDAQANRFVAVSYTPSSIHPYRNILLPVYVDKAGSYWSETEAYADSTIRGIYRFIPASAGRQEQWIRCNNSSQTFHKPIDMIGRPYQDRQGRMWVQSLNGLNLYDTVQNKFTQYHHIPSNPLSLGADQILCMYEDRSGLLWVSSNGSGLNIMLPQKFEQYVLSNSIVSKQDERFHFLKGIAEDGNGVLWIAEYDHNLRTFNSTSGLFTEYKDAKSSTDVRINSILCLHPDDDGNIWFGGSFNRLGKYSPRTHTFRYFNQLDSTTPTGDLLLRRSMRHIAEDKHGFLWLATDRSGLQVFHKQTERYVKRFLGNLDVSNVFVSRSGIVYAGTDGSGVYAFTPISNSAASKNSLPEYAVSHYAHDRNNPQSLSPHNTVKCFYEDANGNIWIGLDGGGLNCLNPTTQTFKRYTEQNGLPNNVVYGILPDDVGNLWLSTNKGISKFSPATTTFRNYDVSDGLQANEFNTNAFCRLRNGKMVFGGIGGINMFFPDSVRDNTHLPPVMLTDILVNDKPKYMPQGLEQLQELTLPYSENTVSLTFAALDYTNSAKNRYIYKMEGIDKDWVQSGAVRTVRYAALPSGEYFFRVKACNNDGVWNQEGIMLRIRLIPPFWQTAWFYALCVVGTLGGVAGTARFVSRQRLLKRIEHLEHERAIERERLERALAIEHERGRISQDIHDEVGPGMTKILLLSGFADSIGANSSHRDNGSGELGRATQEVIESLNSIIWMTNPKNDTLDHLAAYIREYTIEYLDKTAITCRFNFPDTVPMLHLYGTLRRNIFLTVKEALNNIVKHAQASQVTIMLQMETPIEFQIQIADNGQGFATGETSRLGNGLGNMRNRMRECGCGFELMSMEGRGTNVTLYIQSTGLPETSLVKHGTKY